MIEPKLRADLLTVARGLAKARKLKLSTVSKMLRDDSRFFHRLSKKACSFTAKTYDSIMLKASNLWPEGAAWPEGIERPAPTPRGTDG